jgi:hypothetical protein
MFCTSTEDLMAALHASPELLVTVAGSIATVFLSSGGIDVWQWHSSLWQWCLVIGVAA